MQISHPLYAPVLNNNVFTLAKNSNLCDNIVASYRVPPSPYTGHFVYLELLVTGAMRISQRKERGYHLYARTEPLHPS